MGKGQHKAERSCIACRTKGAQQLFIRYVVSPAGELVVDYRDKLPGRGAYTCISPVCIETALSKKAFSRAFRRDVVTPDREGLLSQVAGAIGERIYGLLGVARKAGTVVSGTSMLQTVIPRGEVNYLLFARDGAQGSVAKLTNLAEAVGVEYGRFSSQEKLGQLIGRENRICVGIKDKQFAELLADEINRLEQIAGEN